jgi:hypothetical protein
MAAGEQGSTPPPVTIETLPEKRFPAWETFFDKVS